MAGKTTGLGDNLYVQGRNLSGDIQAFGRIGGGPALLDMTSIVKYAMERQGGLRDGAIEATSYFNPDTDAAHETFGAMPTSDVIVTYCRGTTLGNPAACLNGKQANYDPTRGNDGSLTASVNAQANGFGLEWCEQLTAGVRTDAAATNGASVDFAAGTNFGLQAYLHVFDFTGTDVTVKLQQSSDNGGADAWADVVGGAFTAITGGAPSAQRIQTARNLAVERYLRVVTATTGGFSNLEFAVSVAKNPVEVLF